MQDSVFKNLATGNAISLTTSFQSLRLELPGPSKSSFLLVQPHTYAMCVIFFLGYITGVYFQSP